MLNFIPRRLGLFGGAFNPIHLGHLRAGIEIQEAFLLDKLLFIPTAVPPHKTIENLLPFNHRLKMIHQATAGYPFFEISDIEKRKKGKSYSIETLQFFKRTYGSQLELYFIIGIDAFLEINTWRKYEELFTLSHFVVMDRPGYQIERIRDFLLEKISPNIIFYPKENRFLYPKGLSIYLFTVTQMDISSTQIRALRQQNRSIRYLVPETVENYILEKNYYGS
jgi:nicotinate-nucleotide adenylyltransferase